MSTDEYRWVPPGLDADEAESFLELIEDVPPAAKPELATWAMPAATPRGMTPMSSFMRFQTASHIDLGVHSPSPRYPHEVLEELIELPDKVLLYYLDFLLSEHLIYEGRAPQSVSALGEILRRSGSNWAVGNRQGRYGLVERVPSGVAVVVESVMSKQDLASSQLRKAWGQAYGVNPSPSSAYHDAVKAVEILSTPLISPKDKDATLGKDINVLRSGGHNWKFVMAGSKDSSAVEHLVSMMQLLWHSQSDRHGQGDYQDVSVEEAQAAVLLASTLVGWFSQGALRRVDD
ncbi:hypothetical protein [Kocuria sp.]|uniref:hypothetical protein n=1 Tax=Kocuria sp. TaxID=1871328 RepID=UPI0026DD339E|nr:hypothetical protein [Kocuria sp.]MDO4919934.1 hypothetical protein [Kocuria sp.]